MNTLLARKLVQKGGIREGTVIEAVHESNSLSSAKVAKFVEEFVIVGARVRNGEVVFDTVRANTTIPVVVAAKSVMTMEGMDLERFAGTYDMLVDGSDMPFKKRRGRPTKEMLRERAESSWNEDEAGDWMDNDLDSKESW